MLSALIPLLGKDESNSSIPQGKDQKLKCFVFQFLIKITTILSQIICIRCESERTQSAGQVQRFQKSVKQRIKYSRMVHQCVKRHLWEDSGG